MNDARRGGGRWGGRRTPLSIVLLGVLVLAGLALSFPADSGGQSASTAAEARRVSADSADDIEQLLREVRSLKRSADRLSDRVERLAKERVKRTEYGGTAREQTVDEEPPPVPSRQLPTGQLLETMLDDIDLEVARLRTAGETKQADQLESRVMEIRNKLTHGVEFERLGGRELHVVGMYQGAKLDIGRFRAEVHVTYTGAPVVLCLTSYEPIHWTVEVAKGVRLERIILGGRKQFVTEAPVGVRVEDHTSQAGGKDSVPYCYSREQRDSSASRFPQLARRLKEITGLEVATFQGTYAYRNQPIIVGQESEAWRADRVLAELRPMHEQATRYPRLQKWMEVRELSFTAVHYAFSEGQARNPFHGAAATIGPFTVGGPYLSKHKPFPHDVDCPVLDPATHRYYAIKGHSLVRLNTKGGKHTELRVPEDFPRLSWPCGLAFDTKRGKVVMVSLGGTGYMYGYEPATEKWTLMADMKEAGLVPFVYLPNKDQFVGLQVEYPNKNSLYRYDHQGKLLGKTPVSHELLNHGAKHRYCQAIPVGKYLVLLIGAGQTTPAGNPVVRAFVVEPDTGNVVFSCLHDRQDVESERVGASPTGEQPLQAAEEGGGPSAPRAEVFAPPAPEKRIAPTRFPTANRRPARQSDDSAEAVLAELRKATAKGIEAAPELHAVGVYEAKHQVSRSPGGGWQVDRNGSVKVNVKPNKRPVVLALTAYESVNWNVTVDPGVVLRAVILSGYKSQSVRGLPAETPVLKQTAQDGAQGYFYAYDKNDPSYDQLLARVRELTGLPAVTFQGAYAPGPDVVYRIRPATPGQYKAAMQRIDKQEALAEALKEGLRRAAPQIAAGEFPEGTIAFQSHHYSLFEKSVNWEEARRICRAYGGDLVCIESESEQDIVHALAAGNDVWIGGTDAGQGGRWKWVNGHPLSFTNWGPREPSNSSGGEHHLEMWENGHWNDEPASHRQGFVCEWE